MRNKLTWWTLAGIVALALWAGLITGTLYLASHSVHMAQIPAVQKQDIRIPADVLAAKFGPKHPFWLKVKGPNPIFERAGYTFVVDIDGFGLYPPLYYDVMVYVDLDHDYHTNLYRLYTTKEEGVSVNLRIAGKPL